ncbi:glutamic acid-rich protein-like [Chenopodium quinoa]|uniref:glutamic acid-rich protein-like n=1 Tax=Chenopodium quinoa TaxID=63459 RepID=UPI000B7991FC|nr:glutamic acid-rich protein-like [Chenopodium quinoa]
MWHISYLDRLNIDGRGMMWDKSVPRLGAWEQWCVNAAIAADKGTDGKFGAAEVVRDVVYGKAYPIGESFESPEWLRDCSSGSELSDSLSEIKKLRETRVDNIRKRPPKKGKAKEVNSKNKGHNEDDNGKRKGTVGQGLPQKGISVGKKRSKAASSSRDEQAKRQKKGGKLGKKRRNEDEDEDDPEELSAKLGDKRKISKSKSDSDKEEKLKPRKSTNYTKKRRVLERAAKKKKYESDDNESDKDTNGEDDDDESTEGEDGPDGDNETDGDDEPEGDDEPAEEDEPEDDDEPAEEDEPDGDDGPSEDDTPVGEDPEEDEPDGEDGPSEDDSPDGEVGPQDEEDEGERIADPHQDLDRPQSKKRPSMSPTARRLAENILQKKGDESLRNSVMFKFGTLTVTRGIIYDSFKKNGSISELIMEAFGKLLNEFTGGDPKNGRHVYVMPATYVDEAIKKLSAQGDVGDIVNRCVKDIALDTAVCDRLENHKRVFFPVLHNGRRTLYLISLSSKNGCCL